MIGTIMTRVLKRGDKRYDCVWRASGKQRWKTFTRKRDAERFLTNAVKETQDGLYQHVRPIPMEDLFDKWLTESLEVRVKQGLLKLSTAKSYRSMIATHLRPAFREARSDQMSASRVDAWVREKANDIADGTLAAKTYNNLVNLLHAIVKWARSRGHLRHDPMVDVQRLPRTRVERDFLEPAEIKTLLDAAQPPDDTVVYLAVYSGLRRGELFGLQWADLDESAGQLRIRRSLYQGAITRPKTTHSERTVDLPAPIVARLQVYRETTPPLDGDFIFRVRRRNVCKLKRAKS